MPLNWYTCRSKQHIMAPNRVLLLTNQLLCMLIDAISTSFDCFNSGAALIHPSNFIERIDTPQRNNIITYTYMYAADRWMICPFKSICILRFRGSSTHLSIHQNTSLCRRITDTRLRFQSITGGYPSSAIICRTIKSASDVRHTY